jgi:glycosyltransferase involved in cell wall biosynthesis
MSLGRPVICLNIGGPGMIITDDCGVKITPGSPKTTVHDLAAALERLYLDCDLRNLMGKAARDRVAETYHWDKLGDSLNLIYKTTMGAESND